MTNILLYSSLNSWAAEDLEKIDFDSFSSPSLSPNLITGSVDGFFIRISGTFAYSGGTLQSGTVSGVDVSYHSTPLVTVSGVRLDMDDLVYGSVATLTQKVFGGDDTLTSYWNQGETYSSFGGDDRLRLGTGDDEVDGGTGTDTFVLDTPYAPASIGLAGRAVVVDGAMGRDLLTNVELLEFSNKTVAVDTGSTGNDVMTGDTYASALSDILFGLDGDDRISGGKLADRLFGNDGADKLYGGRGNDMLNGGNGNDLLKGAGGYDTLFGGNGNDRLIGGKGNDVMTGGGGRDSFLFTRGDGSDRITDFDLGRDTIVIDRGASDLSDLDFTRKGSDVLISFANVKILVEDIKVSDLHDAGNFDF
ncbi:calcium-binding protein [Pseudodonghicola flavimaris]|uniref:Calcium-binding protein n=1 Tax=Pseudodonghicola flavimaris TaxID=3050036 RepID=A0ABT7F7P0_9RHOB|nr:calcium-binding protein [Pseudodonghicola flavimaris]MDK3020510.1 calcium-binding protein [Pseudodonghicola flavimaris]